MTTKLALILLPLALAACAATTNEASKAAATPLNDLNVVRAEIPPVLLAAQKAPYAAPADKACPALADEVRSLDAVLGADLDAPPSAEHPSLIERGGAEALRNAAEGVIPFRGWVRKLTGAERYSREVAAAIAAGTVRRAYLKGIAQATGCGTLAAPKAA